MCIVISFVSEYERKLSNVNKEIIATKFRECAQVYTVVEFKELYGAFRQKYPAEGDYLD